MTGHRVHILNGDGTFYPFQKSEIHGDSIIWREGLALGPLCEDIGNTNFWQIRRKFWDSYKVVSNNIPEYNNAFVQEFEKLRLLPKETELFLWFEHDLFCQINLIAILSWLNNFSELRSIQVISIDRHTDIPQFRGFGQLTPKQLEQVSKRPRKLNNTDLLYASKVWNLYCDNDHSKLQNWIIKHPEVPHSFPFLKNALKLHLQRLKLLQHGLNVLELRLLHYIHKNNPKNQNIIVRKMLELDEGFGFGDIEYLMIIRRLKSYISYGHPMKLTPVGLAVLGKK